MPRRLQRKTREEHTWTSPVRSQQIRLTSRALPQSRTRLLPSWHWCSPGRGCCGYRRSNCIGREEFLNFGSAGPAVAAMILSFRRQRDSRSAAVTRWAWFVALIVPCWIVFSLHYLWRANDGLGVHLNPVLIGPALLPALIISGSVLARLRRACSTAASGALAEPLVALSVALGFRSSCWFQRE